MKIKEEYDARLDSKGRVTLKGFPTKHCTVRHLKDGRIIVIPKKLVDYKPGLTKAADKIIKDLK